jgi:hypothetical protein
MRSLLNSLFLSAPRNSLNYLILQSSTDISNKYEYEYTVSAVIMQRAPLQYFPATEVNNQFCTQLSVLDCSFT